MMYMLSMNELKKLEEQFNKEYEFIYSCKNDGDVVGYNEAVSAFDNLPYDFPILKQFVRFRQDFISSDREAASFMFALEALGYLS